MALPLEGIKILDLSTMLPGPFCSMILADFGAEVIKVEAVKGGDLFRGGVPKIGDTGGAFFQVNRNKKSITLNLKSEEGKEIFYKLAKDADVVLEQYRPGVVKKLGVDYETIKAINPKIVYCSLSGYGQTGPYRLTSGHDLNYISYAGILGLTARKGQTPTIPGVQIADIGGGALYAAIGILIALMGVKQNGVGQYVDTSMLDGAVSWLPVLANDYFVKGVSPKAAENILNGQNACYEVYETADGKVVHAEVVDTNGSGHGALAGFLMQHGVDTLICGGIGGGAQAALAEAGIKLYGGVSGDADAAVSALLSGNLGYDPNVHCDHHDHEHGEAGHTCGDHGCGKHSCH